MKNRVRTVVCLLLLLALSGQGCDNVRTQAGSLSAGAIEPTSDVPAYLDAALRATAEAVVQPSEPGLSSGPSAREALAPTATMPTVGPRVRPQGTPTPAFGGAMQPTIAPTSPPAIRVEAIDLNAYRLQTGWTFVQGFVQNTGTAPATDIEILVYLISDRDAVVGAAYAHIQPAMVEPGRRSPWLARVQGTPEFQRVRVQVQAKPLTDASPSTATQQFRLDHVVAHAPTNPSSPPIIEGEVLNIGQEQATEVQVIAAIYDADGALFQVTRANVRQAELAPGRSSSFEARPLGWALREIPRYELFADGRVRR